VATAVEPDRPRWFHALSLANSSAGLLVVAVAAAAGPWVVVNVPGASMGWVEVAGRWINLGVLVTLLVIGAVYAASAVGDLRRVRERSGGAR
jgi:hypothetical protein